MFSRVLVALDRSADTQRAVAAAATVARPDAAHVVATELAPVALPGALGTWLLGLGRTSSPLDGAGRRFADAWPGEARDAGVVPLRPAAVADAARHARATAVVALPGPTPADLTDWAEVTEEITGRLGLPLLWLPDAAPVPDRLSHAAAMVARELAELGPVGSFVAAHPRAFERATILTPALLARPTGPQPEAIGDLVGFDGDVHWVRSPPDEAPMATLGSLGADVLVHGVAAGATSRRAVGQLLRTAPIPVLFVPDPRVPALGPGPIDVADVIDRGDGRVRMFMEHRSWLGSPVPLEGGVRIVAGADVVASADASEGLVDVALPPWGSRSRRLGVSLAGAHDPVASIQGSAHVVHGQRDRIALVDADVSDRHLYLSRRLGVRLSAEEPQRRVVVVRTRPHQGLAAIRQRMQREELGEAALIDASQVLGTADLADLPTGQAHVRLERVARHLRAAGVHVEAIATSGGPRLPFDFGIAKFDGAALEAMDAGALRAEVLRSWLAPRQDRLVELSGAPRLTGHAVTVEMDNTEGRRALFRLVDGAERELLLQSYIVRDDAFARELVDRLEAAAARGVLVRILVDSLYGLHGSFGLRNPILAGLSAVEGISVAVARPLPALPGIADLKQRDHRKLLVADGARAIVSGRNIGGEYYTGLDEVRLTAQTPFRDVPWIDAAAVVEGPGVVLLRDAFDEDWQRAGGESLPPSREVASAGDSPIRVVLHRGLSDTYLHDAYLELIRTAREHIWLVNTFAMELETQRALLDALERGVGVHVLFGNIVPLYGPERRAFAGTTARARELMTELVRARVDPLAVAGADVREVVVPDAPEWDPAVSPVRPHVHAKLLSIDGRVCTVGSGNFDVTATYWESEAAVIVEDAAVAGALEAHLESVAAVSERADPEALSWTLRAGPRALLSRFWPSILW